MSSTDQMKNINAHMVEFIKTHGGDDLETFCEDHEESEVGVIVEELSKLLVKAWNAKPNQGELSKLVAKSSEKKAKKPKDPDAPKRGKSAYIFFSSAKRPEAKEAVMEEKGDDFKTSDVTAKLGAMWREFCAEAKTDSKVKKELEKFEKMAAEDKERYEAEKAEYVPLTEEELSEKLSSQKKKKDPNAPKRGKSAYMFFCQEYRAKVKEEMDDPKPTDVTSELGRRWNELKTDKKKKKELEKFEKMAAEDKERYQEEMAEYVPSEGDEEGDEEEEKPKKKAVPKKGAVKGAAKVSSAKVSSAKVSSAKVSSAKASSAKKPSAYTCFVKTQRPEMKEANPEMSGAEITKQLAKAWKEMDEEGKESWRQRAEEEVEG
jgi:hypothetical protein